MITNGEVTVGNFQAVRGFVSNTVLDCRQSVSMTVLHEFYRTDFGHKHEKKLKKKLVNIYMYVLKMIFKGIVSSSCFLNG